MELEELRALQERKDQLTKTLESATFSESEERDTMLGEQTNKSKSKLTGATGGMRKSKEGKARGGGGGAKANKEMLDKLEKKIDDECVSRNDFLGMTNDLQRALTSVTVFKLQMKIFEKKIMSDSNHELTKVNTESLLNHRDQVFAKQMSSTSKADEGIEFSTKMTKNLMSNVNRIDLLTDTKIGDIKTLMKTMTD